jgi:addiction module RelE/StbE family toxin
MRILFSPDVEKRLKKLKIKNRKLYLQIEKQLLLLQQDHGHPSLRLHKLSGVLSKHWSISITDSIRMVYQIRDIDTFYFIDLGTHDQVYKK